MSEEDVKEIKDEMEVVPDEEGNLSDLQKRLKNTREELKKCEVGRKEYLEGWQRTKADHINYKNDEGKRIEDMARFLTAGLIQEILPVLDSFDLALGHSLSPEMERGILLIRSQFEDILRKRGLKTISVNAGEVFDPERHESIGEVEFDGQEGLIAQEVQRGYMLGNRVLRPARVRLSKSRS